MTTFEDFCRARDIDFVEAMARIADKLETMAPNAPLVENMVLLPCEEDLALDFNEKEPLLWGKRGGEWAIFGLFTRSSQGWVFNYAH